MVFLLWFQYLLNILHSCKICLLVSIGYMLHGHGKSSLGENLRQYLLMGAWLMIALVALAHNESEWPNCCNQGLPLMFDSLIGFRLSLSNSKKFLPLNSVAWKDIFHCERTESHSLFLQKSHEDLHGKIITESKLLESLSTKVCSGHLCLLGQFQNSMWLLASFKKKFLSLWEIATEWISYECNKESNILLAVWKESVMTTVWLTLAILTAWLMLYWIANSLASVVVILTALWIILMTSLLYEWMCKIDVVTCFLILALDMTMEEKWFDNALNAILSSFSMCLLVFEECG